MTNPSTSTTGAASSDPTIISASTIGSGSPGGGLVPTAASGTSGAPADPPPPAWAEIAKAISGSLTPRGIATTEFWVSVVGMGLTALLAFTGVPGSTATQIVSAAAPALIAGIYAFVRTQHKSALADILEDIFPQYGDSTS